MFGSWFKKKSSTHPQSAEGFQKATSGDAASVVRQKNPLAGAQVGANELLHKLMEGMKDDRGVDILQLLAILGSLAGFSCQMTVRKALVESGKLSEKEALVRVTTKDGSVYYYGDPQNELLFTARYSVWNIVGGGVEEAGAKVTANAGEMAGYISASIGADHFGIPRIPQAQNFKEAPWHCLEPLWPIVDPLLQRFCSTPSLWPIMISMAAQRALVMGKGVIDPSSAFSLVMESAIAASKIDPQRVLSDKV